MTIPAILSGAILYVLVASACAGVCKRLGWLERGWHHNPERADTAWAFCVALWPIGWAALAVFWIPVWFFRPMVRAVYRLTSGERRER